MFFLATELGIIRYSIIVGCKIHHKITVDVYFFNIKTSFSICTYTLFRQIVDFPSYLQPDWVLLLLQSPYVQAPKKFGPKTAGDFQDGSGQV